MLEDLKKREDWKMLQMYTNKIHSNNHMRKLVLIGFLN